MGRARNRKLNAISSRRRIPPATAPRTRLQTLLQEALARTAGVAYAHTDPLLRRAKDALTADYQANIALSLSKELGVDTLEFANALAQELSTASFIECADVSGPGFINIRLRNDYLAAAAAAALTDPDLGVPMTTAPKRTIIDYSGPNVAKEMHVGHLRSTVIGDALARVLAFVGHDVIRQNHLGDWGTQFGMLVENMVEQSRTEITNFKELGRLYRESKTRYDNDEEFAQRARARVVALQGGDERTTTIWESLVRCSRQHMRELYARLGVTLNDADIKGESFYNNALEDVTAQLEDSGVATSSEGTLAIFSESRRNKDGSPMALLVRKTDGGYLYGTTDLAALRHRLADLGGERLIYVVDARQSQHFELIFEAAARAHWLPEGLAPEHVAFGSVLGADKRPLKTRSGDNVPLETLLDEAVARARAVVDSKSPELASGERQAIAEAIGVGAIKYADLSAGRLRDYVFSFEHMLALEGNTAPYLQYAHVRARGIARKAAAAGISAAGDILIEDAAERALTLKALEFGDAVFKVEETLEPHRLCTYLYELANTYMSFYEHCPVLTASPEKAASRLQLSQLAADVLASGLDLLGIKTPEVM